MIEVAFDPTTLRHVVVAEEAEKVISFSEGTQVRVGVTLVDRSQTNVAVRENGGAHHLHRLK